MQATYNHPQLGTLQVKLNSRAKRIIFRAAEDGFLVTAPVCATENDLFHAVSALLPKLLKMAEKKQIQVVVNHFDEHFRIETDDFKLQLRQGQVPRMQARFNKGLLEFVYPSTINFSESAVQKWMVKITEEGLRHQSKRVLIPRITHLAQFHSFQFKNVSIHKTHGRWGSCSSNGNINLSLYLILLPRHLQEYVMLHELCHTRFMDHSQKFWELLDSLTHGRCESLRREMKQYDTSIFYKRV